ncbi:hypothetical protein PVAND_005199 [Polypedilum vanderplanki]|uniref:Cationic amino acid transporter n=1 Tax=Polypedilum vanderplanki TaxID=319348 RepID=A0A9J6BZP3_POLVA|nr:hypothetical protein PVAND_005199 [Polypedilum vanderplanki]
MSVANGTFGRWCFGLVVLTNLIAFNESGSVSLLVAAGLAMLCSLLMAYSKNGLNQIQMPYLRASQRADFVCLFMSLWMKLLTLVAVDASIIRTISYCLDTMSGNIFRIYILGRNSSINEPWPDVVGVVIVFLISFMFIMGLENSRIFTILMITGVMIISTLLAVVTYARGSIVVWKNGELFPQGMSGILSASALLLVSFPNSISTTTSERYPKIKAILLFTSILFSILITTGCLSLLITSTKSVEYEAVPILHLLEAKDFQKLVSAMSCLYVIAGSGMLLEIFPETYEIVVALASSEWKVLLKQIGYENRETGSPALAIFLCGSLVAILTFACPMQNLTFIIAGSQLLHGCFAAFFFLYSAYRPKIMTASKQDATSASYSRLNTSNTENSKATCPQKKPSWFLNKALPSRLSAQNISKSINKLSSKSGNDKKEEEREWLLLGEPSSPVVRTSTQYEEVNAESSILSDTTTSDVDCIVNLEVHNIDSETSEDEEDIDTIVEEFQQKVKISTSGLKDITLKVPSMGSWHFSLLIIMIVFIICLLAAYEVNNESILGLSISTIAMTVLGLASLFIPRYYSSYATPSSFTCIISIYFNSIFLSSITFDSWLALIFWIVSGLILVLQSLIKCDVLCCLCLDYPSSEHTTIVMEENFIPNGAASTSIKIKNPPKCLSVVNHVQKYR